MSISLPYKATKEYTYMQYRPSEVINDLREVEKEYIQKHFYDVLDEYINAIDYQSTSSDYIFFWALKYLGLVSLFGSGQLVGTLYDEGRLYDNGEIYDDYQGEVSAFVTIEEMRAYTRFLMSYGERCLNLPLVVRFLSEYTGLAAGEFGVTTDEGHTYITIPNDTERGISLYGVLTAQSLVGMPFGANVIIWKYREEV